MGAGQKNQSRHQQISKNTRTLEDLAELLEQITKTMATDQTGIDKRFQIYGEETVKWFARIEAIEHELAYRAMPFWRRWRFTWQVARERSKERAVKASKALAAQKVAMKNSQRPPTLPIKIDGEGKPDTYDMDKGEFIDEGKAADPYNDTKPLPEAFVNTMVGVEKPTGPAGS